MSIQAICQSRKSLFLRDTHDLKVLQTANSSRSSVININAFISDTTHNYSPISKNDDSAYFKRRGSLSRKVTLDSRHPPHLLRKSSSVLNKAQQSYFGIHARSNKHTIIKERLKNPTLKKVKLICVPKSFNDLNLNSNCWQSGAGLTQLETRRDRSKLKIQLPNIRSEGTNT